MARPSQSRLYSWIEVSQVKSFPNKAFFAVQAIMHRVDGYAQNMDKSVDGVVAPQDLLIGYAGVFETLRDGLLSALNMPMTNLAIERLCQEFRSNSEINFGEANARVREVQSRLFDEFESHGKFFYIPISRAEFFEVEEPFGSAVSQRFPKLTEDIREAAKCYACARYTACVFHLMRIMEHGLQKLGKKLGVQGVESLVWQVILDRVNSAIRTMSPKSPKTKKFAEIAGHLYHVKIAWRNEVMHPKVTYTEEEAENLLGQVTRFMQSLAKVV